MMFQMCDFLLSFVFPEIDTSHLLLNIIFRFGATQRKDCLHHHMEQRFELCSKLHSVWHCICIWYPNFLCQDLLIPYTRNGVSGNGWAISICQDFQQGGNIISSGQFQRLLSFFLVWVSLAGQNLHHQSRDGIVQKMLIF